ncbi:conserved hypothetical protein [Desulfamplus magnetovallimortis]|uniref:PAS domain-containing protein n=1 Tax=Desulfamplus magnetovallimortis TaxID=1246637 RepID=A0A1W1HJH1_9BACT|nr:hypothetical protein [Desulfamplus magnetovallimortis]SLM32508.1 conserved hypothetical protein [Desulfamplus magnetovallimortis]
MKYIYEYIINQENIIITTSQNFYFFAHNNEAQELVENSIIGQSLCSFIGGKETKELYRLLIERVRSEKREISIPFRCDSPTIRRFMKLHIKRLNETMVRFQGCLIKEEKRTKIDLLDITIPRNDTLLRMCSWCKKVYVNDSWLEVENAIRELDLFGSICLPALTHGMCDKCREMLMNEISNLRNSG